MTSKPLRSVLVTGAAAGIGAAIADRFSEAGYQVALFDLNGAAAKERARQLSSRAPAIAIRGDIADEGDVRAAIEETVTAFGSLHVLVNNAGIEMTGSVSSLTSSQWDRQLAVNLRGAFLASKYAITPMRPTGGSIVNISSVHALVSWPDCAAYDTTKAGLIGLTRAMALDHGRDGIRVNAICPGYIDTPLMDRWLESVPDREETMRQLRAFHPVGRIGTPRDVAEAALFLASDAAAFVTGASLTVDGGMTAAGH